MKFLNKVKADKVEIQPHPKDVIDVDPTVLKTMQDKLSNQKFLANTDTVDISAKSIGVDAPLPYKDRGLHIQIRHNKDKLLFTTANKMSEIIRKALNHALETGELKLPPSNV